MAPEIILNLGHGKSVDWWSFGILIYEMIFGFDPFSNEDPMVIYQNIVNASSKLKFHKEIDRDSKFFIKHLL